MEPPYWYYPVRQTLGAALVQVGRAKEAETIFEQALENTPKNGWALYGLMEAQRAQGKQDEAQATNKRLQQAWIGDFAQLDLGRL
jgi:tetratricopeptide (TPR) repeat protein